MKKTKNKQKPLLIALFLFFTMMLLQTTTQSVWVNPGTTFNCENEYYSTTIPVNFTNITISDTWISFNSIGFNITSTSIIYINISNITDNPSTTIDNETVISFNTSTTNLNVTFNISGLKNTHNYIVYNATSNETIISSADGTIQWIHNLTSNYVFIITDGEAAPAGPAPPATPDDFTERITQLAIPVIIAATLIIMLLAMLYAGGLTAETFTIWLILFIIAMITIFTIFGISI